MVFVLVAISMAAFVIIQLPPGDYVTNMIDNMRLRGERVGRDRAQLSRHRDAATGGELGVLLQQAQNIGSVTLSPWLIIPALLVVLTVLAFNSSAMA